MLAKYGKAAIPEFAEFKRRFGWEFNGMRLHELYFGNMSKDWKELDRNSKLFGKILDDFGAFENVCKGSVDEKYRKLMEPNVDTHYY